MKNIKDTLETTTEARRAFLSRCGKYAIATPPTVAILLSATKQNYAGAVSGIVCGDTH
jgi:hypothetical protein